MWNGDDHSQLSAQTPVQSWVKTMITLCTVVRLNALLMDGSTQERHAACGFIGTWT